MTEYQEKFMGYDDGYGWDNGDFSDSEDYEIYEDFINDDSLEMGHNPYSGSYDYDE